MSDEPFAVYIQRERDRLQTEREQIFNQQRQLEEKLVSISRELSAIDAYEAAKAGKPQSPVRRASTGRPSSKREEIAKVIRAGGTLSRGEILERMGLKGDKSGEMSVSNALTALIKANQIIRRDGKYRAS